MSPAQLVQRDLRGVALVLLLCAPISAQVTQRVSVRTGGAQANGESNMPAISADGRFGVFYSSATNLAPYGVAPFGWNSRFHRAGTTGSTRVRPADSKLASPLR